MKITVSAAVVVFALVGCGSDGDVATDETPGDTTAATQPAADAEDATYSAECGQAMAEAAAVDEMQDTLEDTDPAFFACESLEEFSQASADYPDALDGTNPEVFAPNRCQGAESVQDSPLCAEVGE